VEISLGVDFFHVEGDEETPPFQQVLEMVMGKSPADATINVSGTPCRLDQCTKRDPLYQGNLVKIRMEQVPGVASVAEAGITPIELEEHEGIGEQTAFLFDRRTEVLAMQRNRFGVTARVFVRYFGEFLQQPAMLLLHPVLQSGTLRQLQRMNIIRKLKISVAGAETRIFRDQGFAAKQLAEIQTMFGAPAVEVIVKMGHARGSLATNAVRTAVNGLLRISNAETEADKNSIQDLKVHGGADDSDYAWLDLLNNRMYEVVTFSTDSRIVPYDNRREAVRTAWSRRSSERHEMYSR